MESSRYRTRAGDPTPGEPRLRASVIRVEGSDRDPVFQAVRWELFRFSEITDVCRGSARDTLYVIHVGDIEPEHLSEELAEAGFRGAEPGWNVAREAPS